MAAYLDEFPCRSCGARLIIQAEARREPGARTTSAVICPDCRHQAFFEIYDIELAPGSVRVLGPNGRRRWRRTKSA